MVLLKLKNLMNNLYNIDDLKNIQLNNFNNNDSYIIQNILSNYKNEFNNWIKFKNIKKNINYIKNDIEIDFDDINNKQISYLLNKKTKLNKYHLVLFNLNI
jgi:glutamyl-tRNA reductase